MNIKIILLSMLLVGCNGTAPNKFFTATKTDYSSALENTKGFEDCIIYELFTEVTPFNEPVNAIQIVRCPNSTTSTKVVRENGQIARGNAIVVIDGIEYEPKKDIKK